MVRSFHLSMLLVALVLAARPVRAAEPAAPASAPAVTDPYYQQRAQARGLMVSPPAADPLVATAQFDDPSDHRSTLMDPYAEETGEPPFGAGEGEPVDEYGDAMHSPDGCAGDSCGEPSFDDECGDGYPDDFFGPCLLDRCGSGCRVWANFDYLNIKVHGDGIPPLVTTSSIGTPQSDAGVLGEPNTSILFGNERLNNDQRSGGRIQLGYWLDEQGYTAVEGHYYKLESVSQSFAASSTFSAVSQDPQILARPFNNIDLNINDSLIVAFPNFVIGGVTVDLDGSVDAQEWSQVQSAGLLMRQLWKCSEARNHRVYLIGGYRFFELQENLQINHQINPVGSIFLPGTSFASHDEFATNNTFNGVDFGMINEVRWWRLSVESLLKVAVGNMHQTLNISGQSTVFDGLANSTREGGLLALPTNIGHYNRDRMALIPEAGVKVGLQLTPGIRATIGYSFTYVSRVMRPGHQLDLVVNPTQRVGPLVGPARPLPVLESADVFLQGATAGLEFRY